ncbi:FAD-dependent oxidoreductase [Oxynema sp. CENA135]|uniref:phytoene desaturase family protein n=1 Tax=Oxynema sp. CENA135 TaxID=984206 RepID=UPI00190C8725|nr:FAD-dependent oxidoreductase [Oxynema sp. CENA135]
MTEYEAIAIGSGIGGLVAAALLSHYGKRVLVCESHSIPGGAAHSFQRQGFEFDSGPSFYCGLKAADSLNPLQQVLTRLGESVETIAYDPLGHYYFGDRVLPVYASSEAYLAEIARITPTGAKQLERFQRRLLGLYDGLKGIPAIALSADWRVIPALLRYPGALLNLLPHVGTISGSVGRLLDCDVSDPFVRRLVELECFLLSGLSAHETIAAEVAFMFGERDRTAIEYPVGGSGAIVAALVRGLQRWGGELRLNAHVDKILVENRRVCGVRLRGGEEIAAPIVISNATIWDTYTQLLDPGDLPEADRREALQTPAIASFMHLHLGIRADGLDPLTGHHVVVADGDRDLAEPGNTCMISIPTVWDPSLAPSGHHAIHAYTLEPYLGWKKGNLYKKRKRSRAESLYRALERVIPDVRSRVVVEAIGTPLTHARFLRRYRGTYGPAIAVEERSFPSTYTPIRGLYRVGDSTLPGIGVPAVAASGILCANSLR